MDPVLFTFPVYEESSSRAAQSGSPRSSRSLNSMSRRIAGMQPKKVLLSWKRSVRPGRLANHVRMPPVNWLSRTYRSPRLVRLPSSARLSPVRTLSQKEKIRRLPNSGGIDPASWLLRCRQCRCGS